VYPLITRKVDEIAAERIRRSIKPLVVENLALHIASMWSASGVGFGSITHSP
jgi:hypothetical protein